MATNSKVIEVVNRILDFPDLFKVNKQNHQDVREYFKSRFSCSHLPSDFISFMEIIDGIQIGNFRIFSISDDKKSDLVLKYEDFSAPEVIYEYSEPFEVEIDKSNLFFFASDKSNSRYGFILNNTDKVYYLNPDNLATVIEFSSFIDLLSAKVEDYIEENI